MPPLLLSLLQLLLAIIIAVAVLFGVALGILALYGWGLPARRDGE